MTRRTLALILLSWTFSAAPLAADPPAPLEAGRRRVALEKLRVLGSALYVGAHPDDENTALLAYLAGERKVRAAYLALTRGDGGQNLIGTEQGGALGVIRTEELLAARAIDGAEQIFTRAVDFGYSKTAAETLRIWDREKVLADVVWAIRSFRPDVVIARFPATGNAGHGHHTASAILVREAFDAAGDPARFGEQLAHVTPWRPKRLVWNTFRPPGTGPSGEVVPSVTLDLGVYNPALGLSYTEIAGRSRSMHKSQGFGSVGSRGQALEEFQPLAGAPVTADLMDGVDTTWARFPGGADLGPLIDAAIAQFDPEQPARRVPALLAIRRRLADLPDEAIVQAKRRQLDRLLPACLGLYVESVAPRATVVPGEKLALKHTVIVRAGESVSYTHLTLPTN